MQCTADSIYRQVAEEVIATHILPLPSISKDQPDALDSWTERLLIVWRDLDERAVTNLLNLAPIKTVYVSSTSGFET